MPDLIHIPEKTQFITRLGDDNGLSDPKIPRIGEADADIVIGGTDLSKFQSEIRASKWDSEYEIRIRNPLMPLKSDVKTFEDGTVIIEDSAKGIQELYRPTLIKTKTGLEHAMVFASQPSSMVIELDIEFSPGLFFDRQINFLPGSIHASNVPGSYAVYVPKGNNKYRTGKFCHFFMPELIDAIGRRIFVEEFWVENGVVRIVLPLEWMKTAIYPVILDPDIGYTSDGGSWIGGKRFIISNENTPAIQDGVVTKMYVFTDTTAGSSGDVKLAIYDGMTEGGGDDRLNVNAWIIALGDQATDDWSELNVSAIEVLNITDTVHYHAAMGIDNAPNEHGFVYDTGGSGGYGINQVETYASYMADPSPALGLNATVRVGLYFTYGAAGPNDFSGDANCVAVWNMDLGGLLADSKGTNTLTDNNTVLQNVDTKQGDRSGDFYQADDESLSITDANLDAGFPFKNGDANKKISLCKWVHFSSFTENQNQLFSKWDDPNSKRTIMLQSVDVAGSDYFRFYLGFNGGASAETVITFGTAFALHIWYHIGFTFQDSDKSYKIRIWDDDAGALLGGAEETGNSTNNINIEDAAVFLGAYEGSPTTGTHDGLMDEAVVFKDILSSAEIDEIRAGTYAAVSAETYTASGSMGSAGALTRFARLYRTLTGSLPSAGALTRFARLNRNLAGSLGLSGTYDKFTRLNRDLAGSLGLSGVKTFHQPFTARDGLAGSLALSSTLEHYARLNRTQAGSLGLSGAYEKFSRINMTKDGSLGLSGAKTYHQPFSKRIQSGSLGLSGEYTKFSKVYKALTSSLGLSSSLSVGQLTYVIAAALGLSGTLTVRRLMAVGGNLSMSGDLDRYLKVYREIAAELGLEPELEAALESLYYGVANP